MTSPDPTGELSRFFQEIGPFLRGEIASHELEARLGPSGAAPGRLAFYQQLVVLDVRRILNGLYPVCCAAVGNSETWKTLLVDFSRHHRTAHWNPNELGSAFPDFLEQQAQTDDTVPTSWAEIAEFEWTSHLAYRSSDSFDPATDRVNPTATVRYYTHNVREFARSVGGQDAVPLVEEPSTVLSFRCPETLRVRALRPTLPLLVAFGLAAGEIGDDDVVGVEESAVREASAHLRKLGVLGQVDKDGQ